MSSWTQRVAAVLTPLITLRAGNMDDEVSSQSQSQSRSVGEPSTCSKALSGT